MSEKAPSMEEEEKEEVRVTPKAAHFVLVHGAGHGAWCWYKLRSLLENSGHKVTCLDLVGAGIDRYDARSLPSFEDYDKPLTGFMSSLPEDEKVVLVGHSAGGLSVSHAIPEFPEKIAVAIYVGATMLRSGFCSEEDIKAGAPDFSEYGNVDELYSPDGVLREEFQRKLYYHLCPHEDQILASMLLRNAPPSSVFQTARFKGGEASDKVRRLYIKTMQDQALKPWQQDMMIERWLPNEVFSVESDHCPFLSSPLQLCDLLLKVSTSVPKD